MTEKKSLVEAAEEAKSAVKDAKISNATPIEGASVVDLLTKAISKLENKRGGSAKTFHSAAQELRALVDRIESRGGA